MRRLLPAALVVRPRQRAAGGLVGAAQGPEDLHGGDPAAAGAEVALAERLGLQRPDFGEGGGWGWDGGGGLSVMMSCMVTVRRKDARLALTNYSRWSSSGTCARSWCATATSSFSSSSSPRRTRFFLF